MLAIKRDQLTIQHRYVNRFKRVQPSLTVARFDQIENKLDAIVMFDLATRIPLTAP